jgi:hypothetical protein
MPHAKPTAAEFEPGSLIVIDMGCIVDGYASDQTRTVAFGKISDEQRNVYRIVQEAMTNAATPDGMNCSAHATSPFPPSRSRRPTMAVERHCLRVGNSCPAARCQIIKIKPDMKNRIPACRKGGMVSIATLMPK